MSDEDRFDGHDAEPGTIGVGMGGSCPACRAPVDLGQEFCLECGSPIRFTPRQRQKQRTRTIASSAPVAPPRRKGSGFPWLPLVVLLLLGGGGLAFALVDGEGGDASGDSARQETESALPEITNSIPETTSSTVTTTLQDCDPSQPLDGTQPAVVDAGTATDTTAGSEFDEQIPELGPADESDTGVSGFDDVGEDVPSIEPLDPLEPGSTVTVDQDGALCSAGGSTGTDGAAPPIGGDATTPDDGSTGTGGGTSGAGTGDTSSTSSGDWPAGREGWTVIVAGYGAETPDPEARAQQRAADVQEDGFDAGVLFSSDFTSLCPGIHVVFSGVFDARAAAREHMTELAATGNYAGMYDREIRTSGEPAQGCQQVR